jgi:hypothetical protein
MTQTLYIDIASTRFSVTSPDVQVMAPRPHLDADFINTRNKIISTIDISLKLAGLPEIKDEAVLGEEATHCNVWRVLREGTARCLLGRVGRTPGRFNWFALWHGDLTATELYFHDALHVPNNGGTGVCYPFSHLDMRMLMYHLASRSGALMHAAGLDLDGHGLLFSGRSGAGKSTMCHQFLTGNRSVVFSDERIVARRVGDSYRIFGTPWAPTAPVPSDGNAPLSAMFFLAHGPTNQIRELARHEALARLCRVASIPWFDEEMLGPVLDTCADIIDTVPIFELHFRPTPDVVDYLADFVSHRL